MEATATNTAAGSVIGSATSANAAPIDAPVEIAWLVQLALKLELTSDRNITESFFSQSPEPLCIDERDFLEELSVSAKAIIDQMSSNPDYAAPMNLMLHPSRSMMTLYGFIIPPIGDGYALFADQLKSIVTNAGYRFGIVENVFNSVLSSDTFMKIFVIAQGIPQQDALDGEVIDLFSREPRINIEANDSDNVDYKNLNWLQTVHEGDVICKLVRPTTPVDGIDIRGIATKGLPGKMPKIPAGNNTSVTEDGLSLVATADGQLSFKGNAFRVDKMLNIDGSVDTSVGNLDVIGSVSIKENVYDGFTIIASGDIVVRGAVEGAYLKAGGNIQIYNGMNGNGKGRLEAGGMVSSKYLENCYVAAKGAVKSGSIINSTVISSDKVTVMNNKGVIIASEITGYNGIEAHTIGNERNRLTTLTVGTNPLLMEELTSIRKQVVELERELVENEKNISFLDKSTSLDEKYKQLLSKLKLDQSLNTIKLAKKKQRLLEINDELSGNDGQIIATELYPPANITFGKFKLTVTELLRMCRIYSTDGQIIIGKK